ncbi:MAG: hypothetical protein ACE5HJ_08695 [Thermoplasmata archaeon]
MVEAVPMEKVRRAAHLILFKRGRKPGARDWELRTSLGKNYPVVIARLRDLLKEVDLDVKEVLEPSSFGEEGGRRYVAVMRGRMSPRDAKLCGWRIDNLAALAAALAFLLAKEGRAPREDVEALLRERIGRWRAASLVETFVRTGYLMEDDEGFLSLGWRTYAEVDLQELMAKLLAAPAVTREEAE